MAKWKSEHDRYYKSKEREKAQREQLPADDDPPLPPPVETVHGEEKKVGRNDPCPCGSGKKYKRCCGRS